MTKRRRFCEEEPFRSLASDDRLGERLVFGEPLSRHCSLRIGGPAGVWAEVATIRELLTVLEATAESDAQAVLVGLGSNVLFPDEGIDGVVIRLVDELADWQVDDSGEDAGIARIGAGAVNAHVVRDLHAHGWVGAEFLALVPGTFGGAVAMNAGTKHGELAEVLVDADLVVPVDGGFEERRLTVDELGLSYRHSELTDDAIVTSGRIRVHQGDVEEARERVKSDREHRDETQPYRFASVGSTFANPEGDWAGRLIDEVGLKGRSIGDAKISELHANFFINDGEATAADFLRLMALARVRVREEFDVELRPEVQWAGFDGWQQMLDYEREWEEQGC